MKRVILICPDQRPGFESIAPGLPLVLVSFLGKPVIEHTLDGLVRQGVTHVRILASDRPSEVRSYVLNGTAWGLELEINAEPTELSTEEAAAKHAAFNADAVLPLDALPQAPEVKIFTDPAAWHAARTALLPLLAPHQIGCREISPGIWFGLKARAAETAQLHAPCWIGPHSMIRDHATVGPDSFVESDCLIDSHATVENSTVGPRTYVGHMTLLRESIANGAALLNWKNLALTHFTD
ncbi:MAG: Mannose-phosphate guanylyltransferase, partial [Verrucomicrobiales bacterium]|nr:Mannose-phosphate guanylyltransferase [Verrucomicrobiales bacterium]